MTLSHSEGVAFIQLNINEENSPFSTVVQEVFLDIRKDQNNPWISRRTSLSLFLNNDGKVVYNLGISHQRFSTTFIIDIDPYWDRRGFYRAEYNGAINGRVVNKTRFVAIPAGLDYYLTKNERMDYFVSCGFNALFYYESIRNSSGFDEDGERVKPRRIAFKSNDFKPIGYSCSLGFGARVHFSDYLNVFLKLDADYTPSTISKSNETYNQKWVTLNLTTGITYVFNKSLDDDIDPKFK